MPPKTTPSSASKGQTSLFSFFRKTPQAEPATPSSGGGGGAAAPAVAVAVLGTPCKAIPASPTTATAKPAPCTPAEKQSVVAAAATPTPRDNKHRDEDEDALRDSDEDEENVAPAKRQRLSRGATLSKKTRQNGDEKKKKSKKRSALDSDEDEEWQSEKDRGNAAKDESESDEDEDASFASERESEEEEEENDFIASDEDDELVSSKKRKTSSFSNAKNKSQNNKKTRSSLPPKAPLSAKKSVTNSAGKAGKDTASLFSSPSTPHSVSLSRTNSERESDPQGGESSNANALLGEGVVGSGSHEHNTFPFLSPSQRKDAAGRAPTHPEYNPRTLALPASFLKEQTPAMAQWWQFKAQNMDTVLFFKVGKFYELFHMDADIGYTELDLIYMRGNRAHSGFPEVAYGKNASILVSKGYRVARVEQMETPDMLKERNDSLGRGQKDKVVKREVCSVMSKGTRTYCHLDDLSLLDESSASAVSTSLLLCIKERVFTHNESSQDTHTEGEGEDSVKPACEYGVCAVDPVLGSVTLAQFADDTQRSRLRAFLSRFPPTEVCVERVNNKNESESEIDKAAAITRGAVSLVAPRAVFETLSKGEMPQTGRETVRALRKGMYFSSDKKDSVALSNEEQENEFLSSPPESWPAVLRAVLGGLVDGSSELVCVALGGALWQLRRSLIDYEVLSLGKVFAYVPPDAEESERARETERETESEREEEGEKERECVSLPSLHALHALSSLPLPLSLSSHNTGLSEEQRDGETETERDPHAGRRLVLDAAALSQLDILCCADGSGIKGSLWEFLHRARSPGGARLLRQWLCQPLFSVREIRARQAAVQELLVCLSPGAAAASSPCSSESGVCGAHNAPTQRLVAAVEASRVTLKTLPDLDRLLSRVHSNGLKREREPVLFEAAAHSARQIRDLADCLAGLERVLTLFDKFQERDTHVHSALLQRVVCAIPRERDRIPDELRAFAEKTSSSSANQLSTRGQFPLHSLRALLSYFRSIFDEKAARKDGNITPRPGVNVEYDEATAEVQRVLDSFAAHLEEMKRLVGVQDMKYFGNGKDRFQIEVPVGLIHKLPASWSSKSTKKTHRRYWTPFLEREVSRLCEAEERVKASQKDTLRALFARFDAFRDVFERVAQCVANYDALLALAEVSARENYCWPELFHREEEQGNSTHNDTHSHTDKHSHSRTERALPVLQIVNGRHPTVEQRMAQRGDGDFIPNDVSLSGARSLSHTHNTHTTHTADDKEFLPRMLLLTGPNMGGKSTLLRQTCLIVILAQLGCKVPAERCVLTPVDRIFTRVGASDRILAGQSTFFVELAETSLILRNATEDSLCILDELGRGTATFDGTAIAHSVVEYLVSRIRCRALFATHYHLLVQDWEIDPRVRLGHMDCLVQENHGPEEDEEVTFLYKLCDGASPKSYGINVARLAGMPSSLIQLAVEQSKTFEEQTNQQRFAHAGEAGDTSGSGNAVAAAAASKVFAVFERLVSIAHAKLSKEELAFVAAEIWRRCGSMR